MAVERKHAASKARAERAVGKMTGDGFAVLEYMAVAVDDFWLLIHSILLFRARPDEFF
jgi:hypothetical protein